MLRWLREEKISSSEKSAPESSNHDKNARARRRRGSSDDMEPGGFDVSTDLACVILSKIHDIPTRAALMCVSRVWREAGKVKASFPTELDFTTVPNLSEVGYGDIAEFMERIEGIHIMEETRFQGVYRQTLRDGVALDRMRLAGCPLDNKANNDEVDLLDMYVKHDRSKVKAFDKGPFDVWTCEECEAFLDDKSKAFVCVDCEGKNTLVLCEDCVEDVDEEEICFKCNQFLCSKHSGPLINLDCDTCGEVFCMNCLGEARVSFCSRCDETICVRALLTPPKALRLTDQPRN